MLRVVQGVRVVLALKLSAPTIPQLQAPVAAVAVPLLRLYVIVHDQLHGVPT